jgi:hypothetical protein
MLLRIKLEGALLLISIKMEGNSTEYLGIKDGNHAYLATASDGTVRENRIVDVGRVFELSEEHERQVSDATDILGPLKRWGQKNE